MDKRKWLNTTGGPIVILPVAELKNWSGCFSVKSGETEENVFVYENDFLNPELTDYGKACEIEDYIGIFDFGKDKAIVLNDLPLPTCVETLEKDVFIVRWFYAENDEIVKSYLKSDELKKLSNWTLKETIYVKNVDYVMFDSADAGFDVSENDVVYFNLETGQYRLKTTEFNPDNKTFLLIYKFEKVR
jgi:hypothetical protein